ncbi:hypothetical protein ACHAWO_003447 [Cyclotella atomus]|uniref:Uncharacterized protein n=1 Tax=Cyclotella atomus TaxID=382360 RepID=A0ABD3PHX5_9STRA
MSSQASKLRSLLATPTDSYQLYTLSDIPTARSWDYSLPTISCRLFTDRLNFNSDASFFQLRKDVNRGLPWKLMDNAQVFDANNDVVLFGGCLLDIVLNRQYCINDFDLRIVGEGYLNDEARCVAKAKEFVSSIFEYLKKENQIHDLLKGCQPHCSRLAVKDGAVILDHLARFSIENMAIVMDTTSFVNYYCRDATDEEKQAERVSSGRHVAGQFSRFIKYHVDKGFDIILPELDIGKVPRRNLEYDVDEVLPLPCMTAVYNRVDNNSIKTLELKAPKGLADKIPNGGLIGSYDSSLAPDVGVSIHHNIKRLVNEVYNSFKYVARGEVPDDLQSGSISIDRLTGYFAVTPPDEVVEILVAKPLRENVCRKGVLPKPFVLDKDSLKKLVELEIARLADRIESLPETLISKNLQSLVYQFPENVSTKDEVFDAIYGSMV